MTNTKATKVIHVSRNWCNVPWEDQISLSKGAALLHQSVGGLKGDMQRLFS